MCTVQLRCQNRVIDDYVECMTVVLAPGQGSNHCVRNGKHAVAPPDFAGSTASMYFPGRYSDNAACIGYVCNALITDLLRAVIDDGDHQPVVVVARKLVIPELAVQDLESRKLRGRPALWRTFAAVIEAHCQRIAHPPIAIQGLEAPAARITFKRS
jgi:hypothetical protein